MPPHSQLPLTVSTFGKTPRVSLTIMLPTTNLVLLSVGLATLLSCLHLYKASVVIWREGEKGGSDKRHMTPASKRSHFAHKTIRRRHGGARKSPDFVSQEGALPAATTLTAVRKTPARQVEVGETIRQVGTQPPGNQALAKQKQQQAAALQQAHSTASQTCNCSDAKCRRCQRGTVQVHKMGVTLMNTVMWKYFPKTYQTAEIVQHEKLGGKMRALETVRKLKADYRHVVVTRNFYDSLLSGYLYHRRHMECELDWFGKPGFKGWLLDNKLEDWERRIMRNTPEARRVRHPWPPGRARDLCTYLSEESERDGVRVYLEWAKHIYLDPLMEFVHTRRAAEQGEPKTLFVCYEDFLADYEATVQKVGQWFVPGSQPLDVTPNDGVTDRDKRDNKDAHATDRNPELRTRLKDIIRELDEKLFEGAIATADAELACSRHET